MRRLTRRSKEFQDKSVDGLEPGSTATTDTS